MGRSIFASGHGPGVATAFIAFAFAACHAQVKAKGTVGTESESESDRRWEVAEAPAPTAAAATPERPAEPPKEAKIAAAVTPAAAPGEGSRTTFLGVAHDLSLSSNAPRSETCRCLTVAYGPPSDPKWTWQGDARNYGGDTIAIGIATDGVPCSGAPPLPHASIAGVEREGTDIVVFIENVGDGRPVMRGVLAPLPGPNAAIVVRTRGGSSYPGAAGKGTCRVAIK